MGSIVVNNLNLCLPLRVIMDYLYMKLFTHDLKMTECFLRDVIEAKITKSDDLFFEADLFGLKIVYQLITDVNKKYSSSPIVLSERYQIDSIYERCVSHDVTVCQKPFRSASTNTVSMTIEDNLGNKLEFRCYELGKVNLGGIL